MTANEEQDLCEHYITFIILQVYTLINVFVSSMLSFYQYKIINQSIFFTMDL